MSTSDKCFAPYFPDRCDLEQDNSQEDIAVPDYTGESFKQNIPCRFVATGGDETYRGRQLEPHTAGVLELRYFAGVLPSMRAVMTAGLHQGRVFNIAYVKPITMAGRPPMLNLYCRELTES